MELNQLLNYSTNKEIKINFHIPSSFPNLFFADAHTHLHAFTRIQLLFYVLIILG